MASNDVERYKVADALVTDVNLLLNRLVEEANINQTELAQRLNVSRPGVSGLLTHPTNITLRRLASIFWALGYTCEISAIPKVKR